MRTILAIPASTLRATLPTMGKKDLRFYLNGALLDLPKGRIVSTQGHTLFCGQIPAMDSPPVIVPRDAIESALKLLGKKGDHSEIVVTIEREEEEIPRIALATHAGTIYTTAIDGSFPQYERIVPLKVSGEPAPFDPELHLACRDAIRAYTGQTKQTGFISYNGTSAALICDQSCFCVIMPMPGEPAISLDWFTGTPELAVAA